MNLSSSQQKQASLQAYHLAVFRGAIHPEFFDIEARRPIVHGEYDFDAWVFRGGHVLRFEHNGTVITEVVGDNIERLPERGHVTTMPCAGERDHESEFADRVGYMTSIQTETLTGHLYLGTYNEMVEHSQTPDCISSHWSTDNERMNLSVLDLQRYADEVHVQSYHLRSDCGMVLRTQSIFQVKTPGTSSSS
ncbi:MAG: hypothetical protein AB8G96_05150 [Phycisphaerales bacterium]